MKKEMESDRIVVKCARVAVAHELEKKKLLGQPIATYDPKTRNVIMVAADGTQTILGKALERGRYSERVKN
jgi:hypothetical protein